MAPCYGWRSPHTRGARGQALRRLGPRRIIPAYAGSTAPVRTGNAVGSDHPRIRGEHDRQRVDRAVDAGSSPHTRGARGADHPADARRRIIPAYAGSTAPSCTTRSRTRDHPRIRGEHARFPIAAKPDNGSSPHTRGAPLNNGAAHRVAQIIPAYAGSTQSSSPDSSLSGDHPRIRGEHNRRARCVPGPSGSSPHTRGARKPPCPRAARGRIIPAYAGSTSGSRRGRCRTPDHPRIRGEHSRDDPEPIKPPGSSPHTRGALSGFLSVSARGRIIPAYAGSTS